MNNCVLSSNEALHFPLFGLQMCVPIFMCWFFQELTVLLVIYDDYAKLTKGTVCNFDYSKCSITFISSSELIAEIATIHSTLFNLSDLCESNQLSFCGEAFSKETKVLFNTRSLKLRRKLQVACCLLMRPRKGLPSGR